MEQNIFDNSNQQQPKKNGFLSTLKKIVGFILRHWFFVFFPLKLVKELYYDKLRHDQQKVFVSWMFLLPVIIGFLLFFIYPLFMSFIYSFSSVRSNGTYYFALMFEKVQGKYDWNGTPVKDLWFNYRYALREHSTFIVDLWQTIQDTVINTLVITIFSLLIAVMLNGKFKGRTLVRAIFFLPVVFNSEAVEKALEASEGVQAVLNASGDDALLQIFDLKVFMQGLGLPPVLVTFLSGITSAIYNTITYSGIQILIFLTAIQSVPHHLYEAATIEGATGYEQFWKITLPMVSPMILTVVVYTIVDSFLRSAICDTMQLVYQDSEYGRYAAMSWIYILTSGILMGTIVAILSKVVFYYDDKK